MTDFKAEYSLNRRHEDTFADYMAREHPEAEARQVGWRSDMENAPRDFVTQFDLWADGQRYPDCGWGRPTYWDRPKGEYCFVQRGASYDCDGPVDEEVKNPTHWKPIDTPDTPDPRDGIITRLVEELERLKAPLGDEGEALLERLKAERDADIGVLLANIDYLEGVLGDTLDGEDGQMVAEIRATYEARALTAGQDGGR